MAREPGTALIPMGQSQEHLRGDKRTAGVHRPDVACIPEVDA